MATTHSESDWKDMLASAGPYPLEAFAFVRDGLSYTVEQVHQAHEAAEVAEAAHAEAIGGEGSAMVGKMQSDSRHVTGQQLCIGLRDYAIKRYGMMAPAVMRAWNLRSTDDFGRIVFAMIEHRLMSKTAEDTLDDFRSVYDFDEAFARDELIRHVGRS